MVEHTFANVTSNHTISATFVQENLAPTADAGPDQTVDENTTVILDSLNFFDPDDGIATFTWRQIQGVDVDDGIFSYAWKHNCSGPP